MVSVELELNGHCFYHTINVMVQGIAITHHDQHRFSCVIGIHANCVFLVANGIRVVLGKWKGGLGLY